PRFAYYSTAARTTQIYTLSLHDALPIFPRRGHPEAPRRVDTVNRWSLNPPPPPRRTGARRGLLRAVDPPPLRPAPARARRTWTRDRKSTRLNSSHVKISYAVFCLKTKKK